MGVVGRFDGTPVCSGGLSICRRKGPSHKVFVIGMNPQILVAIVCGCVVALLVAIAEGLHARRVKRGGRLAFGPEERPRGWTRVVAPLRCVCLGAFAWGLATLIVTSSGMFE